MRFVENRRAFMADFTVTAIHGSTTGKVLFDEPTNVALDGMVSSDDPSITYFLADFPGLDAGEAISVDGTAYLLRQPEKLDDGVQARAGLRLP